MHGAHAQRQTGQKAGLTKLESLIEIPIAVRTSASSGARGAQAVFAVHNLGVKTQIWIAVSVYVLVAIVRKRLPIQASLYSLLQVLSITLFEKMPILQAFQEIASHEDLGDPAKQLILFDS